MTYLLLAIASLSLLGASNNIKPTVLQAEGEPTSSEVATSSAETSSSTDSSNSTDTDITDEQESELDKLVDAITNSNWWKGVFAAVIAWLTANGATLLGLAIGLLRQRAKTALAESKYKADVQLIAEKFSVKEDELEKKLDSKLDDVIDTCVKTLKEAGNEKAAAELLAGVSSSNKVDAILKEEESSQEDK
jgi:hypothetical protein